MRRACGAAWGVVRLVALGVASAGSLMSAASGAEAPNCSEVLFAAPDLQSRPYLAGTNPFYTSTDQQCTWYVFGRVLERSGQPIEFTDKGRDAYRWPDLLVPDYQRLQAPQAGAVAIWKHKDFPNCEPACGHVAYVEAVQGNSVAYTEANFSTYGKGGGYDGRMKCSLVETFEDNKGLTGKWEFVGYVMPQRAEAPGGQEPQLVRLSPAEPSAEWSSVIEAPGYGVLKYKVFGIDVSAFRSGGVLTVDVFVAPDSKTAGSFNIFPEGVRIPTEGHPYESVAGAYDVPPGVHARLEYRFERGQTVSFGADGNWFSPTGAQGRALVRASVAGVSSQGGSFEGEYVNSEFGFGFRIQGRQGVATISNSPNYQVGDVMLTFVEISPTEFRGQQLCTDGRFHPVTGVLNEAGNLEMTIEGCSPTRYTMARQRGPGGATMDEASSLFQRLRAGDVATTREVLSAAKQLAKVHGYNSIADSLLRDKLVQKAGATFLFGKVVDAFIDVVVEEMDSHGAFGPGCPLGAFCDRYVMTSLLRTGKNLLLLDVKSQVFDQVFLIAESWQETKAAIDNLPCIETLPAEEQEKVRDLYRIKGWIGSRFPVSCQRAW